MENFHPEIVLEGGGAFTEGEWGSGAAAKARRGS
jgi:hypothetical protein